MVSSPEVILGTAYMPESSQVMSSNPRQEEWTGQYFISVYLHNSLSDSSQSYSLSQGRNEDDISTLGYEENYCCNHEDTEKQIGLSYGMLDDTGSAYEPVKLKTISLCCY